MIDAILVTYDNPIDFYVLANGWLQIIVNEDFDSTYALSHQPQTFGGLRVSYIQQTLRPSASRISEGSSVGTTKSSVSSTFSSQSATPCSTGPTQQLRIGGVIKAKVKDSKKDSGKFQERIGVMTECENRLYVTVPTHLITEAWLSTKKNEHF
ncbi:hypothetical protein COCVIDRAFT_113577 [Bipolaris victoriae FI3]|uniref:Uncharacterized protein n=1 Tax=Bipolaris victoriae (strain FI3) TaxID=930091 RepID=W7E6K2_BIPV3|nr:hypothetical protein COCVIDRAFT_113577 [Bipolaris victoriae FI3]